jgi:hypothetical protein
MNEYVNFTEAHGGKRIYSIETRAGVVHVIADAVYLHLSDAMRVVKGREEPNPVIAEMEQQEVQIDEDSPNPGWTPPLAEVPEGEVMVDGTGEVKVVDTEPKE